MVVAVAWQGSSSLKLFFFEFLEKVHAYKTEKNMGNIQSIENLNIAKNVKTKLKSVWITQHNEIPNDHLTERVPMDYLTERMHPDSRNRTNLHGLSNRTTNVIHGKLRSE